MIVVCGRYRINTTWHGGSQPNLYNQWLGIEVPVH